MTRILTHTLLLLCCALKCAAQAHFGHEWIDYGQTYLRIPVAEAGIYRITARELAAAGMDSLSASGIQLFAHGREVPLEMHGDWGKDGYLQFEGRKNDGYADTVLYARPDAMPHPYYNLYSDTTAYFLTCCKDGLRTPLQVADSAAFHWEENVQLFTSHYLPGRFFPPESNYENGSLLTGYDAGEGWTGPGIAAHTSWKVVFQTKDVYRGDPAIDCALLLAGWTPGVHTVTVWAGARKVREVSLIHRETKQITFELFQTDLNADGEAIITLIPAEGGISLSYARIRYAQTGARKPPSHLRILPPTRMQFKPIDPKTEYLIITHPLMHVPVDGVDPVMEYARYRASGYKVSVVHSQDLYDQFHAGQPGPEGLRRAIRWLHAQGHLKFVLLAGRSVDPQKARKMKDSWQIDMVPNAGWPGSDVALVSGNDFRPLVPVGRINAANSRQLLDYLRKVQAMEAQPAAAAWRKRILHLSGGRSYDELNLFKSYLNTLPAPPGGKVTTISKLTDDPVEPAAIDRQVNAGIALMTLFGHSALDVTDLDIGRASDPARNYQNHPRYPAVIVNGCAAGSIFYSSHTLSSDWIFAPQSGAVLFLAHTFNAPSTALKRYTDILYEVLADSAFTALPFGTIQQEAIRRNLDRHPGILDSITVQQMLLHGDPAIRIFPAPYADTNEQTPDTNQPPVMLVTVDGRQLMQGDAVSPHPAMRVRLFDDALPAVDNDTSMIAVWLKKQCEGCVHERISLRNARGTHSKRGFYEITWSRMLEPGIYTLVVQCRDLNGLSPPPYQIGFVVPESEGPVRFAVSPNPSGRWFRFTWDSSGPGRADFEITITNTAGTTVHHEVLQGHTGHHEWFWTPGLLPAGLYHYTISTSSDPAPPVETVRGHLLFAP